MAKTRTTVKPVKKHPTDEEIEERIEYTLLLLNRRLLKSEIKKLLKDKYDVVPRTCEVYLSRARERIVKLSGRTKQEHLDSALNWYESVVQGDDAKMADKLAAHDKLDRLLGLEDHRLATLEAKLVQMGKTLEEIARAKSGGTGEAGGTHSGGDGPPPDALPPESDV